MPVEYLDKEGLKRLIGLIRGELAEIEAKVDALSDDIKNIVPSEYVKYTDYGGSGKAGLLAPSNGFNVGNDGMLTLDSNAAALYNRIGFYAVTGDTMDYAWKEAATNNQEEWTAEDYEKFYTFLKAVKDYHTDRNGIARFNDGRLDVSDARTDTNGALSSGANVINARTLLKELGKAVTEAKNYADGIVSAERAEIDASIATAKTKTRYGTYTNAHHYPLAIGGWYMAFSSDSSLKICKADGTAVVSGARHMLFMSVPYSETEKEKFVVMGMYFYDGTFSITNPKVPMEFIQIQVDSGSYITANSSATFNVSTRIEALENK